MGLPAPFYLITLNMGKIAKLILVSDLNNNKFYNMTEDSSGATFTAEWGRVDVTSTNKTYSITRWNNIYNSKLKKGYKDKTGIFTVENLDQNTLSKNGLPFEVSDSTIKSLIVLLQDYANDNVTRNYRVSAGSVTEAQLDEAQEAVDLLSLKSNPDIIDLNEILLRLYETLPRKMGNVKDHLFGDIKGYSLSDLSFLIQKEQDLLDTMRGQAKVATIKKDVSKEKLQSLTEATGLTLFPVDTGDIKIIKSNLGRNASQFKRAFKVSNVHTQTPFDVFVKNHKKPNIKLFWHGSRNENWWSIMNTGLKIRPTNAVITGKMFGSAIYLSNVAQKSINYTSLQGSYWAGGSSDSAFLALYDISLGKPWNIFSEGTRWRSSFSDLTFKKVRDAGYDSVFAEGGADLLNNEYMVYQESQLTIKYLVEIKN